MCESCVLFIVYPRSKLKPKYPYHRCLVSHLFIYLFCFVVCLFASQNKRDARCYFFSQLFRWKGSHTEEGVWEFGSEVGRRAKGEGYIDRYLEWNGLMNGVSGLIG